jgi:hypothetical protein
MPARCLLSPAEHGVAGLEEDGLADHVLVRMEMAARGELEEGTRAVAAEMTARLGDGPVTVPMTAYVIQARPSRRPPG